MEPRLGAIETTGYRAIDRYTKALFLFIGAVPLGGVVYAAFLGQSSPYCPQKIHCINWQFRRNNV